MNDTALVRLAGETTSSCPLFDGVERPYLSLDAAALRFVGRSPGDDVAIICRNTTDAINHLAYAIDFKGARP